MGIPANHPAILDAAKRGLIHDQTPAPAALVPEADDGGGLVLPVFVPPGTWVVPIRTASEANLRDWRGRSNRTKAAREAVSSLFGKTLDRLAVFALHFHAGGVVRAKFTRLGGRTLDRSNLPISMKSAEDAVCLMMGVNDGDPRWDVSFAQQPGGQIGVRVELELGNS